MCIRTLKVAHVGKLKKRAERFGEVVSNSLKKVYEDERKRKRLERFGTTAASSTEVKKVKLNSTDSDLEVAHVVKLNKRAERFGEVVSNSLKKVYEDERKRKRLERFGTTAASSTEVKKVKLNSTDSDLEVAHVVKLNKRAERFGEVVSNSLKKVYEDERKRKRLQRFGTTAASSTEVKKVKLNSTDSDLEVAHVGKLNKRAERFGEVVSNSLKKVYEDERKRKRLQRFGTTAASSTEVKKVKLNSTDSDLEVAHVVKLKKRAERFGEVVSNSLKKVYEDERKRKRLERFGTTAASSTEVKKVKLNSTDSDLEVAHVVKLNKRAERFGEVVSNSLKKVYEDERKRKRLERFGTTAASSTEVKKVKLNSTDSDLEVAHVVKLNKRAERFGEVVSNSLKKVYEDERKRKRLQRFGTTAASSTEVKKVKLNSTDSDLEVAHVGKLNKRAERFGEVVSNSLKKVYEDERKRKRLQRFGTTAASSTEVKKVKLNSTDSDLEVAHVVKLKKRAERFGEVVSNSLKKVYEDERKRKRLERFGTTAASSTEVKKVKLNSTDSDLEERKKKRAERFGLT